MSQIPIFDKGKHAMVIYTRQKKSQKLRRIYYYFYGRNVEKKCNNNGYQYKIGMPTFYIGIYIDFRGWCTGHADGIWCGVQKVNII